MHWSNNAAQLVDVDEEIADAIIPGWLWTQSDVASTMLLTPESVLSRSRANPWQQQRVQLPGGDSSDELVRRRLRSRSQRWRRRRSSWSCWARSFVVVTLCVCLTVRGQGGSQCILNESACTRPEGSDNTDAFVTLLPMGHFSAT